MTARNNLHQAVAIIGMAGRFPGANSVDALWQNVVSGTDALHVATDEELKESGYAEWQVRHKDFVRAGGILAGAEDFDAAFFGFSAHDASIIDPQHRVFLECAWEAFEDAGYDPTTSGNGVGLFAGSGVNSYRKQDIGLEVDTITTLQLMVGSERDFLATRVAYKLNLTGPAITVQTACSTSLVAVHMACESIRNGSCAMALAGGVSIMFPQKCGYIYQPGMILSPDGYCRAFDAKAAGTTMGRGAGVVLLKPLEAAVRDRDQIYAVIRGSAANNDGSAKGGYTAPAKKGQADVVRSAMEQAQFAPSTVRYVEAHGTGTEVGDSIEIAALAEAFAHEPSPLGSCTVSSLKAQIGHLDAAAGIANLIKATMAVRNRVLPGTMHFERPNPELNLGKTPFRVHHECEPYLEDAPFRAGVSAFGIGGTNAHVCLEEWEEGSTEKHSSNRHHTDARARIFPLSAHTHTALAAQMARLALHLEAHPEQSLEDVAFTLQKGRKPFAHRAFTVAADRASLIDQLRASAERKTEHQKAPAKQPEVYFLFPGQGTQYVNMGRGLYESDTVFRDVIDQCSAILEPLLHLDLRQVLFPEAGHEEEATAMLKQTRVTQPALFTLEYALAMRLMANGIVPAALIGHSLGEYVAATVAGVFRIEHILNIIANRGLHIQKIPPGSMLATSLSEEELRARLPPELSIAVVNGPRQTIVSGPTPAIEAFAAVLKDQRVPSQQLMTSHAFHSSMLDPIVGMTAATVRLFPRAVPKIPFISNYTGTWITDEQATSPEYYDAHLRQTVRFGDGLKLLTSKGRGVFIEVGPGENLLSLVRSSTKGNKEIRTISTTRRANSKSTDVEHYLQALGQLWLSGVEVDWESLHGERRPHRISLPTYPFERQRYWIDAAFGASKTASPLARGPLVKQENSADWLYTRSWRSEPPAGPSESTRQDDHWVILAESQDRMLAAVHGRLQAHGRVITVSSGAAFSQSGEHAFTLNFNEAADYASLLEELRRSDAWPGHIVFALPSASTEAKPQAAFLQLFHLAQALQRSGPIEGLSLHVLTDCAYDVLGQGRCNAADTAVASLAAMLGVELRGLHCHVIDYDRADLNAGLPGYLVHELTAQTTQPFVAYRGRTRWLPDWTRLKLGSAELGRTSLRQGGTYILTGGGGGIGLVMAEHLAKVASAHVVLVGRSSFPRQSEWARLAGDADIPRAQREKAIGWMRILAAGGSVELRQADVRDEAAMQRIVHEAQERRGGLSGIIHAAGISDFTMIGVTETAMVDAIFAGKAEGTRWIEGAIRDAKPDFVLLCSSMSAIVPSVGVSAYGAANAYLDGFAAQHDDPRGTRVFAVNWDRWSETGMAYEAAALTRTSGDSQEPGIEFGLSNAEAMHIFDQVLTSPVNQVAVSTRDVSRWIEIVRAPAKPDARTSQSPGVEFDAQQHGRPALSTAYVAPETDMERAMVAIWQELLGIDQIGVEDDFFELGGHSLLGAQFIARVRERFLVDIPLRTIFETPTPAACARLVDLQSPKVEPEREEIEI